MSNAVMCGFLIVSGFQFDYVFDWTILKYQQSQLANPPSRALVSYRQLIFKIPFMFYFLPDLVNDLYNT